MFIGTLKFFAALAVVIAIVCGAGALYDYATAPAPISEAQRAAQEAEYQKREAEEQAAERVRTLSFLKQARAQWDKDHKPEYRTAYATSVTAVYSREVNQGLVVDTVTKGERVEILSNVLYNSVKVKTQAGTVGWIYPAKQLTISAPSPETGLTYLKHTGVFHGMDYCNTEGYGVPAGEIDQEDGSNWLNDPDCKN